MGGFSAITEAHGWLIAALGISVVFLGLASLVLIISHFPHVIGWWNGKSPKSLMLSLKNLFHHLETKPPLATGPAESTEPGELDDVEEALRLLTAHLGEPFRLPRLLEVAEQRGLARPHSTLNRLLLRGTIEGGPDGLFRWGH